MSNPFDYLKKLRERRERTEQQEAQKKRGIVALKRESVQRYSPTVVAALRQLSEAYYPKEKVEVITEDEDDVWCIGGHWEHYEGRYLAYSVKVELEFDKNNQPIGFACWRGSREQKAGLSAADLAEALKALHPEGAT